MLALSAGAQSKVTGAQLKVAGSRPNIIFILADDLSYGDLGCYGQQKIETPQIDALARAGLRFTQFYAGTTVCAPSRASLMTGRHTGHTPVRGNREFKPEGQFPLPDTTVTIARLLQTEGYVTADFGKWGLGYPGSSGEPLKQGMSFFYGLNCQALAHNYYPDHLWENDRRVELAGNRTGDSVYSADLIHRHAMEFLRASGKGSSKEEFSKERSPKERPFFLFLSYTLPHAALSVPHDEVYDHYVRKFHEEPRNEATTPKFEKAAFEPYPHAAYAAMVSRLDKYVGEIRAELERQGIAGNTLVIFSSDNGPHKEGGNDPEFFDSNGPFRGIKRDLYEGGIRVPFIVAWPGKIKAGAVSSFAGAFWDLYPTFGELGGAEIRTKIDGVSIVPTLMGDTARQRQHAYLYWEFHENGGRQAVRWGKWKGVRLNVQVVNDVNEAPMELYDLEKDGGEKINIAAQHPDVVARMSMLMKEAHTPDKNWPLLAGEGGDGAVGRVGAVDRDGTVNQERVVDRDGNVYNLKVMSDNRLWMTDNLNINIAGSYCYEDSAQHCRQFGRLYTWKSAQEGCRMLGEGWHLATDEEWKQMAKQYGGVYGDSKDSGKTVYKSLLSGGGSGFNAVLGGGRGAGEERRPGERSYGRLNAHGFYWSATESGKDAAWFYNFGKGSGKLYRQNDGEKEEAISVRCVK